MYSCSLLICFYLCITNDFDTNINGGILCSIFVASNSFWRHSLVFMHCTAFLFNITKLILKNKRTMKHMKHNIWPTLNVKLVNF